MWKGIGVYYFEEEHEALLLDGIRPVIRSIQTEGKMNRSYVLRDFNRGPHIIIYSEIEQESQYSTVCKEIEDKLSPYLRKYPSRQQLSMQGYSTLCDKWMEPDSKKQISSELRCNHQIVQEHSVMNQLVPTDRVLQDLLHSFYAFNYEIVIGELEATRSNRKQRYLRMLKLMAANHAYDMKLNVQRGLEAPRLRIERYLMGTHECEHVRRQYRDADTQLRTEIDESIGELLRHTNEDGVYHGSDRVIRRWSAARGELYKAVCTLTEEGLVPCNKASFYRSENPSLAHLMLLETTYALFPLFHIDRYQKYLLEFLLLQCMDRQNVKPWSNHLSTRKHRYAVHPSL